MVESIRKLSDADFKGTFLALSRTESILRDDPAKAYPCMDLDSRGNYHTAIQEFVRGSKADEFTIVHDGIAGGWIAHRELRHERRHRRVGGDR